MAQPTATAITMETMLDNCRSASSGDKTAIIIQARTGSTRLPRKMALPFDGDRPVLAVILGRIAAAMAGSGAEIVVATTTEKDDDLIESIVSSFGIKVFRGSQSDVLGRFIGAARSVEADRVIRVCADNVFLDMESLRFLYETFRADSRYDYMSFRKSDGTPSIKTHYGFWTEAVTLDALLRVAAMTDEPLYHEHVTNYIYAHPDLFRCCLHPIDPEVERHEDLRLTMDTAEDYSLQRDLYAALGGDERQLNPTSLIKYLDMHRELYATMRRNIEGNSK